MNQYPIPSNENERIQSIRKHKLMGLGKDADFDIIALSAASLTGCSVAMIAIMEEDIQRIQSSFGLTIDSLARKSTICQYTLMGQDILLIEDTLLEERTASLSLVKDSGFRFYAGVPIIDDDGFVLGTLCVVDFKPKKLNKQQTASLLALANAVKRIYTLKKKIEESDYYTDIFQLTQNMICVLDDEFKIKELNPSFSKWLRLEETDILNRPFLDFIKSEENEFHMAIAKAKSGQESSLMAFTNMQWGGQKAIQWHFKYKEKDDEIFAFGRDITQETEERARLENSERKFRNFFENSLGLMSMHDMEGNILQVNEKGREMLGYSEEEIQQLNLRNLITPRNRGLFKQYLKDMADKGELYGTMILRSKAGEDMYFLYNNVVEQNMNEKPNVISMALNITERRKLEKDLIRTKQILEHANSVAQVGGWEFPMEENKVFLSAQAQQILDMDIDEPIELETLCSKFDPNSAIVLQKAFDTAVKEGQAFDLELKIIRKEESLWIRVKAVPEYDDNGTLHLFGIFQDIHKSKSMFLELQKKEAMLQAFVRYIPASVSMFDNHFNYIAGSNQWMEEFKIDKEKVQTENLFTLFPKIPQHHIDIYHNALKGVPYKNTNEKTQFPSHGGVRNINWEVRPWHLPDNSIGGIIIATQDITESVKRNEELKAAIQQAEMANKAKSEFLANMSHEIRTPLNGVIGFSDLLIRTPLNDTQKQYLKYINESGNSLLNIINDILDFSKIESGKMELIIDQNNIYELTNQVVNVVLFQAQRKNLELLLNVEQGLPQRIWIDESRLKQVLINLMGNAVKFTEEGEIELKVESLAQTDSKIKLRFSVRDTGIGIAKEKQEHIFNAFTQEDSSVSKRYGGTGLGLTISNNLLKYMDSNLNLISDLDKGSIFYFDLEVDYKNGSLKFDQELPLPIRRAMIVDDNENNRIILQHMLQFKNIETTLTKSGAEALQLLLEGEEYDLILVDYHMPILSGTETIAKMKTMFENKGLLVPLIILHTSSEEHEILSQLKKDKGVVGLMKPIKSDELYLTINRAIQKTKREKGGSDTQKTARSTSLETVKDLAILLADDNSINMALNIRMLSDLLPQSKLVQAADGEQALNACQNQIFDLIVMDVQMPRMDGLESTRLIRQLKGYKHTPIIGLTAGSTANEREKCMDAGMSAFLAKPIRLDDLKAVLLDFISKDLKSSKEGDEARLDIAVLQEHYGDDEAFKVYFLNLIIKELENTKETLQLCKDKEDNLLLGTTLHKLKGTSSSVGLRKLTLIASHMENDLNYNQDVMDQLQGVIKEVGEAITLIKNVAKE